MDNHVTTAGDLTDEVKALITASSSDSATQTKLTNVIKLLRSPTTNDRAAYTAACVSKDLNDSEKQRLVLVDLVDRSSHGSTEVRNAFTTGELQKLESVRMFAVKVDKKKLYQITKDEKIVASINNAVFKTEPTGSIQGLITRAELLADQSSLVRSDITSVLSRMKSMDMGTASLNKLFEDKMLFEEVPYDRLYDTKDILKRLARLQSISPSPEALIALWNHGAFSAAQVAKISKRLLMKWDLPEAEIDAIIYLATSATHRNQDFMAAAHGSVTSMAMSMTNSSKSSRKLQVRKLMEQYGMQPTLEGLLGSMDYGVVNDDQTVYSPTAYLVDLLMYLKQYVDDDEALFSHSRSGEEMQLQGTALERFYRRRPDILHMDLSPENTTTVLPYIDLVNEVMESFITHLPEFKVDKLQPRRSRIDAYNVAGRDSEDLLSQPQNFKIEAYRQLAGAIYPTNLPYHQPLDAQRAFLSFLGVPRSELVKEFRTKALELTDRARHMHQTRSKSVETCKDADTELAALQERALKAQDYCETLNLCQEEFLIWTKGVFWEKEHFIHTEGLQSLSDDEYRRRVGLKDVWQYWGYATVDELLSTETGAARVKAQLLPRLGITYIDLVDIVQTRFCNPSFPTGQTKLIMESIRSSYKYLQGFLDTKDSRAYENMAKHLSNSTSVMSYFTAPGLVTAGSLTPEQVLLKNWLTKNFSALGKIIVLEKNEGPILSISGPIYATESKNTGRPSTERLVDFETGDLIADGISYSRGRVGDLKTDGSIVNARGSRIGSIGIDGEAFYGSPSGVTIDKAFSKFNFSIITTDGKTIPIKNGALQTDGDLWELNANMGGTSKIDNVCLEHLDGTALSPSEWDRLHLFTRIWRSLQWSVRDTDRALRSTHIIGIQSRTDTTNHTHHDHEQAIKFNDFTDSDFSDSLDDSVIIEPISITFKTVEQLAALKQIITITGMPLDQILTIWTNMSTTGSTSQYNKLFNKRNLREVNDCFLPDNNGNYFNDSTLKITTYRLTVIAALNIKNSDLDYLMDKAAGDMAVQDELNLSTISRIYAHSCIAKILSVKIVDLFQIFQAFGSPFESPAKALEVIQNWQSVTATIPWEELRFIVDTVSSADDPLALTQVGSLKVSKQLRDGALKIQADYPAEDEITDVKTLVDDARKRMSCILESSIVDKVLALLQGTTIYETKAPSLLDAQTIEELKKRSQGRVICEGEVLKIKGILSESERTEIMDVINVYCNASTGFRMGSKRPSRSAERRKREWADCIKKLMERPVEVLKETLVGVLPSEILDNEMHDINRNILAPDVLPEGSATGVLTTNHHEYDTASTIIDATQTSQSSARLQLNGAWLDSTTRLGMFSRSIAGTSVTPSIISLDSDVESSDEEQAQPDEESDDDDTLSNGRSATQKLKFFIRHFTPYLHQRLTYNSIVDTLQSLSGFKDVDLAKAVLENVLTPVQPASTAPQLIKDRIQALPYVNKNADLATKLYEGIYRPYIDKTPVSSLIEQTKTIAKLQSVTAAIALYENITSLAPSAPQSALDFVLKAVSDDVNYWQGYLQPPESGMHIFTYEGDDKPEDIVLSEFSYISQLDVSLFINDAQVNKQVIRFMKRVEGKHVRYVSNALNLDASKKYALRLPRSLYGLQTGKEEKKNIMLKWRTSETSDVDMPIPKTSFTAWWKGYVCPSINDIYTFFIKNTNSTHSSKFMILNNERQEFSKQQAGTELFGMNQKLDASSLNTLELHGCSISELMWKIGGNAVVNVPTDCLLPQIAPAQMQAIFMKLKKLALFFKHIPLTAREMIFMKSQASSDNKLDFDGIHDVEECIKVQTYAVLKKSLSAAPRSLIDLFSWASSNSEVTGKELVLQICSVTNWAEQSVTDMLEKANFSQNKASDFTTAKVLAQFGRLITLSKKIDVDMATLFAWASPLGTAKDDYNEYHEVSQDIQRIVKSRFASDQWVKAVRPINNQLREKQRKSLVSYLLVQDELTTENNITDADGLFEYFLMDVQTTALNETSRVVQATASVQLFIQRCFLGLEEKHGITAESLNRQRWQWMSKYRVWEANRKIFLYPENWIEASLRDNKTDLFKDLESELLQKNITSGVVDSAIKRYVANVANISDLQPTTMYVDRGTGYSNIHVFARTRNYPFIHYYNSFTSSDGLSGYWSGWQDIKIEIPYISDADVTDGVAGNLMSATMLHGRLLLFVAEMIPGQKTEMTTDKKPFTSRKWDIRMSWTEYRDGRWIARQTCPDSYSPSDGNPPDPAMVLKRPKDFILIPQMDGTGSVITINICIQDGSKAVSKAAWSFDGVQFYKSNSLTDATMPASSSFGLQCVNDDKSKYTYLESMQQPALPDNAPRIENDAKRILVLIKSEAAASKPENIAKTLTESYNRSTGDLMSSAQAGYESILRRLNQIGRKGAAPDITSPQMKSAFGALDLEQGATTLRFNERSTMYSLYHWELGLHVPMIMIEKLLQTQQYEEALRMCHTIFDPSVAQDGQDARRCWQFVPFKLSSTFSVEEMFMKLASDKKDSSITEWKDHPFLPHLVARSRPQAYMRWVVMTYIKILVAWGDSIFKQNTLESIPQATQIYVLASHIYGPRGQPIPQQKQVKSQSFWSLCEKFDDFSNAMVDLEQAFPYSNQTSLEVAKLPDDDSAYVPTIFGSAATLYFAIPDNPAVRALAATIDDRLFKIRNSQDIDGNFRKLPLFAPPIDPALLVLATAQGLSIGSVLQDLQGPLPNCKLSLLLQKAFELVNEVKSLGQSLLGIREKKDMEKLSNIRQRHETAMQKTMMDMKNLQLEEANQALENLQAARIGAVSRLTHFIGLVGGDLSGIPDVDRDFRELDAQISKPISEGGLGLSPMEQEMINKIEAAGFMSAVQTGILTAAGVLYMLPNAAVQCQPLGVGGTISFGPENLAAGLKTAANGIGLDSDIKRHRGNMAGTMAGFQRAMQDRILQANSAGYEVVNINKQITASRIRIAMAKKEIAIQQQQIDQIQEVTDFFREKYATADLYSWMDGVTKTLYHQYYTQAFDLAKKAELAFKYERPQDVKSYINPGYFDSARDGLLAGENLYRDLKLLESAYLSERGYQFEVTKSISLRTLAPLQLMALRETGTCLFDLDELLFDMDFPGHYLRRIKSVNVTVPCVVGPYTSVNATLTLMESECRIKPGGSSAEQYRMRQSAGATQDDRFVKRDAPIKAIAVCSAQNDAGVFQLDFNDSSTRYMPFEGAGAISKWKLELPSMRQFDYDSIFDVVLQMRYTSNFDGTTKIGAELAVREYLADSQTAAQNGSVAIFDIRAEYATAWASLRGSKGMQNVELGDLSMRLPYMARQVGANVKIKNLTLLVDSKPSKCEILQADKTYPLEPGAAIGKMSVMVAKGNGDEFGKKWSLKLDIGDVKPLKCLVVVDYTVDLPTRSD